MDYSELEVDRYFEVPYFANQQVIDYPVPEKKDGKIIYDPRGVFVTIENQVNIFPIYVVGTSIKIQGMFDPDFSQIGHIRIEHAVYDMHTNSLTNLQTGFYPDNGPTLVSFCFEPIPAPGQDTGPDTHYMLHLYSVSLNEVSAEAFHETAYNLNKYKMGEHFPTIGWKESIKGPAEQLLNMLMQKDPYGNLDNPDMMQ